MVSGTATRGTLQRIAISALLLAGLFGGGVLLAPGVEAASPPVSAASDGGDHAAQPSTRRANESGTIGDVRTVISGEAHRCHKDCNHHFYD
jgi:hypothetical protein